MTAYIPKYLGFALDMAKVDAMRIGGRIVPVPISFPDAEVSEYEEKRDGSICRIYPADLMGRIYKKEGDKYEDLGKPEFVAFQCYRSPSSAFIDSRTCAERRWCMNRRLEAINGPDPGHVGDRWATISA
jgi:hypothetical protein